MSLQDAYNETSRHLESGHACASGCTGRWHLSDFDTWHACPHGDPGIHPEHREDAWIEAHYDALRERAKVAANALVALGMPRDEVAAMMRFGRHEQADIAQNLRNLDPSIPERLDRADVIVLRLEHAVWARS